MKKKHILLIAGSQPAARNRELNWQVKALHELGYAATVIITGGSRADRPRFENRGGIDIYHLPAAGNGNHPGACLVASWRMLFLCLRIFFRKAYQVIHLITPADHILPVIMVLKLLKVKYIFDQHYVPRSGSAGQTRLNSRQPLGRSLLARGFYSAADLVIARDLESKKSFEKNSGKQAEDIVIVTDSPAPPPAGEDIYQYRKACLKRAYSSFFLIPKRRNWQKSMRRIRMYYLLKPYLPRKLQYFLRKRRIGFKIKKHRDTWPIDLRSSNCLPGWQGWPGNKQFALVLTHDVDREAGFRKIHYFVELEKSRNLRSSFYFVPECYDSRGVHEELRRAGFEVAVHGLSHDGKMFFSYKEFMRRVPQVNHYLQEWQACGFRSPCMHHNLQWIMHFDILYDSSTYDTDPFEPLGGGQHTIFPYIIKNEYKSIVELPYTLPQDHLLFILMQKKNIDIWKRKIDWIAQQGGMVLFITHPDYIDLPGFKNTADLQLYDPLYYRQVLDYIQTRYPGQYWNATASEVAAFWQENCAHLTGDRLEYLLD